MPLSKKARLVLFSLGAALIFQALYDFAGGALAQYVGSTGKFLFGAVFGVLFIGYAVYKLPNKPPEDTLEKIERELPEIKDSLDKIKNELSEIKKSLGQ